MKAEQLREMAEIEEAMAQRLESFSADDPFYKDMQLAGKVCAIRADMLRALAGEGDHFNCDAFTCDAALFQALIDGVDETPNPPR